MENLERLTDRLVEYSCGSQLFHQADSAMYSTLYADFKKAGKSAEMATKMAHQRVIEKILREELG